MSNKKTTKPYGSWKSPISAELVALGSVAPTELTLDGDHLYWLEIRPEESGRFALCTLRNGRLVDVLGREFNVRTRVHEYGGGSYLVHKGTVYFTNFKDQLLYVKAKGETPRPLTRPGIRYADLVADDRRSRLIGVSEDHTAGGGVQEVVNTICAINHQGASRILVSGNDFYSSPRLNATSTQMAWLSWNHPNMPWDGTELWVAELKEDGTVGSSLLVAGGREESVFQPEWSPNGILYFVSDRSGWWNVYRWDGKRPERLVSMKAEFGRPQWTFGQSTYAFESERRIVCSFLQDGAWNLAALDTSSLKLRRLNTPFSHVGYVRARTGHAFFTAASPKEVGVVATVDLAGGSAVVAYSPTRPNVDSSFISVPKHVGFPTERRKKAYAFFYAPKSGEYAPPRGGRPPLIVVSHGGPTSFSPPCLNLGIQYWTSRGFAVLDVNYRGSTGYGREYMKELRGKWGIVDVEDCAKGAIHMTKLWKADRKRLIIRGGSAGGFTTLCALTFKRGVFAAGASYYGVSDLEGLEKETHKFESHYSDRLVAPYPQERDVYLQRSPVFNTEKLFTPTIFFQGLEDPIVPPNQSERMVAALRAKGIAVAYLTFEGEQHGFRKAGSLVRSYKAELYFYSKVLDFSLADEVEPIRIYNLPEKSGQPQQAPASN